MRPGLAIVSFWQGIAEVVLRTIAIVLAVLAVVTAAVAVGTVNGISDEWQDAINDDDKDRLLVPNTPELVTTSRGTCAWILFLSLAVTIHQSLVILLRFLNVELSNLKITIFLAIDIVLSAVFALGYLAGGVAAALCAKEWKLWQDCIDDLRDGGFSVNDLVKDNGLYFDTISAALFVTAGGSLLAVFAFGLLLLWMCFFIAFKWNARLMNYNAI